MPRHDGPTLKELGARLMRASGNTQWAYRRPARGAERNPTLAPGKQHNLFCAGSAMPAYGGYQLNHAGPELFAGTKEAFIRRLEALEGKGRCDDPGMHRPDCRCDGGEYKP